MKVYWSSRKSISKQRKNLTTSLEWQLLKGKCHLRFRTKLYTRSRCKNSKKSVREGWRNRKMTASATQMGQVRR